MAIDDKVLEIELEKRRHYLPALARYFHEQLVAGNIGTHPPTVEYVHPIRRITAERTSHPELSLWICDYGDWESYGDTQYTAQEGILRKGSPYEGQVFKNGVRLN